MPNVALAWLLNQPLDIHPIVGANSRDELVSNLDALDIPMEDAELKWLNLESEEKPW